MPVIGVRQCDGRAQVLKPRDEAVPHMGVHQNTGSVQILWLQVRPLPENVTNPLVMDHIRPARPVQIRQRQAHEEVALSTSAASWLVSSA